MTFLLSNLIYAIRRSTRRRVRTRTEQQSSERSVSPADGSAWWTQA